MTAASEAASGSNTQEDEPDLLWRAFACSGSGILITEASPECPIVFANPAFCRMTGYSLEEVVGKNCRFLQNGDRDQPALELVRNAIAHGQHASVVLRNYRKDGTLFWNHLHISPIVLETGNITHYIGVLRDVTAEKRYEELLTFRAMHDSLTNLPNRQFVEDRLTAAIYGTEKNAEPVGLLVLNIDNFKLINDALGHDGADELLRQAAVKLQAAISEREFLMRNGVDEFAVIIQSAGNADEAATLAERLSHALAGPYTVKGECVRITSSAGIALYPKDGDSAAALSQHADIAMHRAKELGGNKVQLFSAELGDRVARRHSVETALRDAIEKDELTLHYQPQVDLQTGRVVGFEALLRWTSRVLGAVEPVCFIAIAEECGLIDPIGEWVLQRACRDMRRWADAGLQGLTVAVNISPRQFRDPRLADKIARIVTDNGIEASRLALEITETTLMQDTPVSKETLERIHAMGIPLALDDFGTGYSSLGYLKRYPFAKVKIDRSFVENVATDADDAAIAKAAISMAHSLGIHVVAEGVETEVQCDFLRRNMCDEIQGFLFSRAIPPDEVEKMLRDGRSLPAHLLRFNKPQRTLLLVDDEANILAALKRLLRRDDYNVLTANSGAEGLEVLEKHTVDVIVSDQRMPGMTGVEFLGKAKEICPDTVRIVLSGYTELQSVTEAINKGSIYKFLTKPWDDAQLREQIALAFRQKEMADENQRLTLELQTANVELAASNRKLAEVLEHQRQLLLIEQVSLDVVREVVANMPTPVIGLDEDNVVAFVNAAAQQLFAGDGLLLGCSARLAMPELLECVDRMADGESGDAQLKGRIWRARCHRMGQGSQSRGRMITLLHQGMPS